MPDYIRPPITEAVIEIQFADPTDQSQVEKISKKFKGKYPKADPQVDISAAINIQTGQQMADMKFAAIRLENITTDRILILGTRSLALSALAPYCGWDAFFKDFKEVYQTARFKTGHRKIMRIAMRYINRIDVPLEATESLVNISDYLNVGVITPPGLAVDRYEATITLNLGAVQAVVRTATMQSVMPGTAALYLDQDVFIGQPADNSEEFVFNSLNEIRGVKNALFEQYITEKTRELFRREIEKR